LISFKNSILRIKKNKIKMAILDPILNPILGPLFNWNSLVGILVVATVVTIVITLAYKYLTDQEKMKHLKGRQKEFQKEMKSHRDNPEKMMSVQKEAMKVNMEYMKHSLKPTLFTMLPILLIFGWMSGALAYDPIMVGESYTIVAEFAQGVSGQAQLILDLESEFSSSDAVQIIEVGKVTWRVKSTSIGEHQLAVETGDASETVTVLVTDGLLDYKDADLRFKDSDISRIQVGYSKLTPLGDFDIFGYNPGWLALYIVVSLVLSLGLRKAMGLH
jgi:uncharacterized membrane protein (DUF106 family)